MDKIENAALLSGLRLRGEALAGLIQSLPIAAHLKDAETGKCLLSTPRYARQMGFQSSAEVEGLTVQEIQARDRGNVQKLGASLFLYDVAIGMDMDLEREALSEAVSASAKLTRPRHTGFISIELVRKRPVLGEDGTPVAVFSCSEDLSYKTDILSLFHLYQQFYPKKEAIQYFLKYLKVWGHFLKTPTLREVSILCALVRESSHKMAGAFLGINPRTAEIHARNLRQKLKAADLHAVLVKVRDGYKDRL